MKQLAMIVVAVLACVNFAYGYDFEFWNLYYTILSNEDKTVSVTSYSSTPKGNLIIPQMVSDGTTSYTVTEIGRRAFYNCSGLTSVSIQASVKVIGEDAFYSCSGLTSVSIPNSVTKIGRSAFRSCSGLTSVSIPNSVTEIGEYAFSGCLDRG